MAQLKYWFSISLVVVSMLIIAAFFFFDKAVDYVFYDDIPNTDSSQIEIPTWVDEQLNSIDPILQSITQTSKHSAVMPDKGLDRRGLPASWMLVIDQVITTKKSAELISQQIKKAGYHIFLKQLTSNTGLPTIKGYVGPWITKQEAIKARDNLEQKLMLHSKVIPYEI